MAEVTTIVVRIGASGAVKRFSGRFAWALTQLIRAGQRGVTPIDQPAPRWSHYVYRLRRDGIPIKTLLEEHGGAFPGRHGRYVITAAVMVVGDSEMKGRAA